MLLAATAHGRDHTVRPRDERPALWLVGLTGSGQEIRAGSRQLFGRLPLQRRGRWRAGVERQLPPAHGWFSKDALYFVDDFSPRSAPRRLRKVISREFDDGSSGAGCGDDAHSKCPGDRGIHRLDRSENVPETAPAPWPATSSSPADVRPRDQARGARCLHWCTKTRPHGTAFRHHL